MLVFIPQKKLEIKEAKKRENMESELINHILGHSAALKKEVKYL